MLGWRFNQLLAVGLDITRALELAENGMVDVHELVALVDHGCPPHLAVRIVAPLPPPARPAAAAAPAGLRS